MANDKGQSRETPRDDQVEIVASVLPSIRYSSQHARSWMDILLSVFAVWLLFIPALLFNDSNTPSMPRHASLCGLSLIILQLVWALFALFIFRIMAPPGQKSGKAQARQLYSKQAWFHTYRGINLAIITTLFFLTGIRWLRLFDERTGAFIPVLGLYALLLVWSVLQRRLLLRWAVEGLPRWLKWFLFGSMATGAGIGTGIGIILGRYGPRSIVELTIGLIAFGFALVGIPRAVYDLYVAYLHWQAWRREKEVAS